MYLKTDTGVDQNSDCQLRHVLDMFEAILRQFPSANLKPLTAIQCRAKEGNHIGRVRTQELASTGEHEMLFEISQARIEVLLTGFTGKTSELGKLLAEFSLRVIHHPKQRSEEMA